MADEANGASTAELIAAVNAALNTFRTGLTDASTAMSKILGQDLSSAIGSAAKDGADRAKGPLKELTDSAQVQLGQAVLGGFGDGLEKALNVSGNLIGNFADSLKNGLQGVKIAIGAGFDPKAMTTLAQDIGIFASKNTLKLGLVLEEDAIHNFVMGSDLGKSEKKMMEFSKNSSSYLAQFSTDSVSLKNNVEGAMSQAADAMGHLGISSKDTTEIMSGLAAKGLNVTSMFGEAGKGFSINLDASGVLNGLNATETAYTLFKGSSLEVSDGIDKMGRAMNELGYKSSNAAQIFGTFNQIAAASGMPTKDVSDSMFGAAKAFQYLGGNIESVAGTYKNFIDSVGEGKKKLAIDLAQEVTSHIANMNMGQKAFLGMTGRIGGEGGAIGAGLRVEKAMETGEGMEGILEDLKDTLRRTTGADVLTRDTAISTGQEQQYESQRQIAGGFLGITDPGKLNVILKALSESTAGAAAQLAGGREKATEMVGEKGIGQIRQSIGPLEQSLNMLGSLALTSVRQMHSEFINLDSAAANFSKNFFVPLKEVLEGKRGAKALAALELGAVSSDEKKKLLMKDPGGKGEMSVSEAGQKPLISSENAANRPAPIIAGEGQVERLRSGLAQNTFAGMPTPIGGGLQLKPPTPIAIDTIESKKEERTVNFKYNAPPVDIPINIIMDERGMASIDKYVKKTFATMFPAALEAAAGKDQNDLGAHTN